VTILASKAGEKLEQVQEQELRWDSEGTKVLRSSFSNQQHGGLPKDYKMMLWML
jgi:hypothetical protein